MLFPLQIGIAGSLIFEGLNALLLESLRAGARRTPIDETRLPVGLLASVQANEESSRRLEDLRVAIDELDAIERDRVYIAAQTAQMIRPLFSDLASEIPSIPERVRAPLRVFGEHLFSQTAKLVGITQACGESVMDHYVRFAADPPTGNGNVCGMCGTEYLAQRRANVATANQWRAPYDHLLSKETYPIFSVHPDNLLPICRTCNEKAKLRKDLLHDTEGQRRECFDPWSECAEERLSLSVLFRDLAPFVELTMIGRNPGEQSKLQTWNDVYRIQERVEGEFMSFREKIAEDISLTDLATFKASLLERQRVKFQTRRHTPYNYWRAFLFRALLDLPDPLLEQLRELCEGALDPNGDAAATFGI